MLNPSSANESDNDPTIRRCIAFAKSWGFGGIEVCNIFAYRSSTPEALLKVPDPVGTFNDVHIEIACTIAVRVIVAWGAHLALRNQDSHGLLARRERQIMDMISLHAKLYCLKETRGRYPSHPLYLDGRLKPRAYTWGLV